MVSLKDISVRCGVSVATVSKALNGHKDVSAATREKLLNSFKTKAESLGYDITFISRSMGKNKMSTYEHCKYRNVDGVIIACTDFTSQDVYEVVNGDIPIVTIDHIFDCSKGFWLFPCRCPSLLP